MGIVDWFRNRLGRFDPDRAADEAVVWGVEKAVALTNPKLRLLPDCEKRLAPAVAKTVDFLREQAHAFPAARPLSAGDWSSDPAWRAFFVASTDIPAVLGRSDNLRTLFDKFPELDHAHLILGMAVSEQKVFGMALQGNIVQRDVAQVSVSFSDHQARLCGGDEMRLRRVVGVQIFEYLVAHALAEIGAERVERQELQASRSLIRARLRLLEQHGPGLGSLFGSAPAARSEQARLEAELLDNERQLEALGASESALDAELECLATVLSEPQRYLRIEPKRLRLNAMNVVVPEASSEAAADIDFAVAELSGSPPMRRAFVVARVARTELPAAQGIDFAAATRYL